VDQANRERSTAHTSASVLRPSPIRGHRLPAQVEATAPHLLPEQVERGGHKTPSRTHPSVPRDQPSDVVVGARTGRDGRGRRGGRPARLHVHGGDHQGVPSPR